MTPEEICAELDALRREHHVCEGDCWFTCPANNRGEGTPGEYRYTSCNDQADRGDYTCDCGADEHNAKIDALQKRLRGKEE